MTIDALISLPTSLLLSILVARSIGPDVLGVYNFAIWILGAGVSVVTTGVTSGMQIFAAEKLGQGDVAAARDVLLLGFRWQLLLIALLVVVGAIATLALSPPQFRLALLVSVASIIPAILLSVPAAGLGAAQAYSENVLPSIVANGVNVAGSLLALQSGWGLAGLTGALCLSRLVDLGLRYISWRRVWHRLERDATTTSTGPSGGDGVARMRRYAWRSSLLLLIEMIVWDRSEFVVLTRFSALRELAFYSLSFNIVQQALVLPKMFAQGFGAYLLLDRGRDPQSVVRHTRDGMRYTFLLAAPLTLGLAALDRAIVPLLYGAEYGGAVPVIAVVAGLAVLKGALVPVQALLQMTEQQPFLIRFSVVMGLVNITLDLLLIPSGGALGAAWANGITQGLSMIGLATFATRQLGLKVPVMDMAKTLLACAPMVLAVRVIVHTMPGWSAVAIGIPAGAIVYAGSLRQLGVLRDVDGQRLASLAGSLPVALHPVYSRALRWLARTR